MVLSDAMITQPLVGGSASGLEASSSDISPDPCATVPCAHFGAEKQDRGMELGVLLTALKNSIAT